MKKAFSYIRFSRLHQEEGDSKRRQQEATRVYCERNGLQLDESLSLRDLGVSAFKGANAEKGALGTFLEACRVGSIPRGSALIVESLDRLTRQKPRKAISLLTQLLDDYGIEVHLTMTNQKFLPDNDNGFDLILAVALAMRAHDESETKSSRLKDAWANKRSAAASGEKILHPTVPWWLEIKDGKIKCPPERAKVVRKIFKLTSEGLSSVKIIRILNKENTPTWRPKAMKWSASRVRDLIRADSPMGVLRETSKTKAAGRSYEIKGYYPVVVKEELVLEARAAMKNNLKSSPRGRENKGILPINLLRGILRHKGHWFQFSANANGMMDPATQRKSIHCYYQAHVDDEGGRGVTLFNIAARQLESVLLSALVELPARALMPAKAEGLRQSVALQKKVNALEDKLENLLQALESGSASVANRIVEIETELKIRKAELEKAISNEQQRLPMGASLEEAKKFTVDDLYVPERRQALSDAIHRLITRIDIARSNADLQLSKGVYLETLRMLESGEYQLFDDHSPANRPRKPLAMLITFVGGAQRLVCRALPEWPDEIPSGKIISMRVEAVRI
jgi:DNA invertase Pin-like site-specific DNA recombinase